jgi:hypothetical protein
VHAYRRALPTGNGWCGLVQGATPEVIDLMVSHGAKRVVSMDLHLETIEAMRVIASEDWTRVEATVGDWTQERPELQEAFDIVICDGGPLFLPFPAGWRSMYETTHRQLKPGGKTVFRTWVEPPDVLSFEHYFEGALERFEREREGRSASEQRFQFVELVSELKSASLIGTVDQDGTILEDLMWPIWQSLETGLRTKYGNGSFREVVSALFDRTNPVGEDGAHLVAAPNEQLIRPLLEDIGFKVDMVRLNDSRLPAWDLVVTAEKP